VEKNIKTGLSILAALCKFTNEGPQLVLDLSKSYDGRSLNQRNMLRGNKLLVARNMLLSSAGIEGIALRPALKFIPDRVPDYVSYIAYAQIEFLCCKGLLNIKCM